MDCRWDRTGRARGKPPGGSCILCRPTRSTRSSTTRRGPGRTP